MSLAALDHNLRHHCAPASNCSQQLQQQPFFHLLHPLTRSSSIANLPSTTSAPVRAVCLSGPSLSVMVASLVELQKQAIIDAIRNTQPVNTWRCCVVDETSYKIITNVMEDHHILDEKVSGIAKIEDRRPPQEMECLYILTPEEHIVRCMISDWERPKPRYAAAHLLWTAELPSKFRDMILASGARNNILSERVLSIDYFPRESHLLTLREPTSFYNLYHPECGDTVPDHLLSLARNIVSACVTLGEYPTIRYYKPPPTALHHARALSHVLAQKVQEELDLFAQKHRDFPPQSNRPRGVLFIVDRSIDLYSPFLHEFTYQAMAHDLLPIKEGDEVTYKFKITNGAGEEEEKELPLNDNDTVWVAHRHEHMKDTIQKLMEEFKQFMGQNKNFVDSNSATSLYAIRDMMATLPQFQGQKDMYSLHLTMAQECMNYFEKKKLPDVALLEQALATGYDESGQIPRNAAETLVRLLDDPAISPIDRIRLIAIYLLYKDGLLEGDIQKLIHHAQLKRMDERVIRSLDILGARVTKPLKDPTPNRHKPKPKPVTNDDDEGTDFSRYVTSVKAMLEDHVKGALDTEMFPYVKPELIPQGSNETVPQTSLRSAKPTWARTRLSVVEPKQRVFVFMAGGATYAESRACYEVSKASLRDVFLGTTHMLSPSTWLTQLSNLRETRARLGLPVDQPPKQVPQHLLEPDPVPKPAPRPQQTRPVKVENPAPRPAPIPAPASQSSGLKVHHQPDVPYYKQDAPKKEKKRGFGVFRR